MRTIILILHFLLISSFSYAQIENYFKPSERYFNRTFEFITDTWETSDGRFHNKHTINYSYDRDKSGNLTGNIKRTIKQTTYRYNAPWLELTRHEFFNISNNTVTLIYSYTEGLSDELIRVGLLEDNYRNLPILKTPNTTWVFDEIETEEHYKSEFGRVSTKYGTYDCIIVTVTGKSKIEELKWVENFVQKFYYAENIGLIKTETFDKSGNRIPQISDYGVLIDEFSSSSDKVLERRKDEERELNQFLKERKTRIYDYREYFPAHYIELQNFLDKGLRELLSKYKENINIKLNLNYNIDTLGVTKANIDIEGSANNNLRDDINKLINSFSLKKLFKHNYSVFGQANYKFLLSQSVECVSFQNTFSELEYQSGDYRKFQNYKQKIAGKIEDNNYPIGNYQVCLIENTVNNISDTNIDIKEYNSFAGPSSAFASVLVPGLGKRFVTGGEQKGVGTTVFVYSLIGGGIVSKIVSNSYYDKYQDAINQNDINNYYKTANNLNRTTYFLIGAGTLIWLYDIYWVIKKGTQNKKNKALMNNKLKLSFSNSFDNNISLGITINF